MTDITQTASVIRDHLRDAERYADRAIAALATVTAQVALTRADCDDPALLRAHGVASQAQLIRLHRLQATLVAGRGDMSRVHGGLLEISREMMGPDMGHECPEEERRALFGRLRPVKAA